MALTNFVVTAAILGAAYVVLRGDVRHVAGRLRTNLRHLRQMLEEEGAASSTDRNAASKVREIEKGPSVKGDKESPDAK